MSGTKSLIQTFLILLTLVFLTNCSSFGKKLKNLVGGSGAPPPSSASAGNSGPSFSSQPNLNNARERRYKRVTKENFSDDEALEENAGSLWKKVGQGSYLFSQNNLRMMGDVINVEVEGKAADNLSNKVKLIRKAFARYERPLVDRKPTSQVGQVPKPEDKSQQASNQEKTTDSDKKDVSEKPEEKKEIAESDARFDTVPCRIVERNADGSYRVKGQQPIFIGTKEYKLIVTGIVRPDDISTELVTSSKLIDSKMEIVATSKETK